MRAALSSTFRSTLERDHNVSTDATDFITALSQRRSGSFDKMAFCARARTCQQIPRLCREEGGGRLGSLQVNGGAASRGYRAYGRS